MNSIRIGMFFSDAEENKFFRTIYKFSFSSNQVKCIQRLGVAPFCKEGQYIIYEDASHTNYLENSYKLGLVCTALATYKKMFLTLNLPQNNHLPFYED